MNANAVERLNAALTGRYHVERELGEGGMAKVYLATDLRHNRNVAVKVLKPELAAVVGAERFLAEIQTTANLQHPHILPLYDSGEAGGFLFYVMPYVEGETLRDRLDREKQLPVDEAVRVAVAVAQALDYAHKHGVVHRDIKPANILMQAGQPVVGDFGIALAVGAASGARLTETGLSVGTPYYMSPEQATGDQVVGPPSDIYALGAVLYELLTGDPPYMGSTAQAVLGKILQGGPVSATAIRRSIPPNVDAAIRKALEKLPADRFTEAVGFAKALQDPTFRHSEDATSAGAARSGRAWQVAAVAAGGLAILFAAAALQARSRPAPAASIQRFAEPFLEGEEPAFLGTAGFDLSPDGTMLVYRHNPGDGQILMVRRWDELSATPVRETQGASNPAVSFDGLEIAFQQANEIKVLALAGGPVRSLGPGTLPEWGDDGYVYASADSGAIRVPAAGGAREYISRFGQGENQHVVFDLLPGGRKALLQVGSIDGTVRMRGLDMVSGDTTELGMGGAPRYLPSGHLVYGTVVDGNGVMMAVRFDPDEMRMVGTPVAVLEGITAASLSDDGTLFYSLGALGADVNTQLVQLVWVTREGAITPVDSSWTFQRGGADVGWSISEDGSMVALRERTADGNDIWIKRLDDGPRSRLTFGGFEERMPEWVPGTSDLSFLSTRGGGLDVWSQPADGTREAELVLDFERDIATVEWSPDRTWLLMRTGGPAGSEGNRDIYAFRPGVDSAAVPLLADPGYDEINPAISPDGRFLAYQTTETDRHEVYVRPFPDVRAGRWQVSVAGGRAPMWSQDGRELFFAGPANEVMVVEVEQGAGFRHTPPRVLLSPIQGAISGDITGPNYDIAPDGRFLMGRNATAAQADTTGPRTVLVNNFVEELRARVPE
jgi:serine/threonine-protein kinase